MRAFSQLEMEWNGLLSSSETNNYSLSWEWLWTWWDVFAQSGEELCILLVSDGKELISIAPFYAKRHWIRKIFPIRQIRFLGTGEPEADEVLSEYMDIICRKGRSEVVVSSVLEFVLQHRLCDEMGLSNIESTSRTIEWVQKIITPSRGSCRIIRNGSGAYIALPSDWEQYLAHPIGKMRYGIRSDRRRLQKFGEVHFRKTLDISELREDFNELVRLHQSPWEHREKPGVFGSEKFTTFHKMLMPKMLGRHHLELWFLSISGNNVAAKYNIRYKNKIYSYQAGLDDSFGKSISLGLVLISRCLEEAIKEGLSEYDFMMGGGPDSHKARWTKSWREFLDVTIAYSPIMRYLNTVRNIHQKLKAEWSRAHGIEYKWV